MGNCATKGDNFDSTVNLSRSHFEFVCVIGMGGFGKVWKVQHKGSKQLLAMKEMQKGRIIIKKSVASVMNERRLLSWLRHPFIVNMHVAFQDRDNLFLVMDLLSGGDLRYHMGKTKVFTEEQTKFFVVNILIALEYVHSNGIMHRDLKPENMVLDAQGYIRLTDFGIARTVRMENNYETSGTPGYMAPEVICRQNHGMAVDYFALGVIMHEFMLGCRPYFGRSRKEIRELMLARQAKIQEVPPEWSIEAVDFCNRLIQRKPANRLGVNGIQEVKAHPWLRGVEWERIAGKRVQPPYRPEAGQNFDSRLASQSWKDDVKAIAAAMRQPGVQAYFEGYFYDCKLSEKVQSEPSRSSKHPASERVST